MRRRNSGSIRVEIGNLKDEAEGLLNAAEGAERDLSASEKKNFDTIYAKIKALEEDLARAVKVEDLVKEEALAKSAADGGKAKFGWRDGDGRAVHVLASGDKWAELPHLSQSRFGDVSVGDCIRSMITGKSTSEIRNAMSEGASSAGLLVPEELSSRVVDLARAISVMGKAGVQTVPMHTDRMTLAKLEEDPTITSPGENEAFVATDATFGAIGFTAKTFGCVIDCSRELAEDAPNFVTTIETAMAKALAAALDNMALDGSGISTERIVGIVNTSGINTVAVSGAITWEKMNDAVALIRTDNCEPNAYVLHPTIMGDLAVIATGDGSNSAKLWQPAPNTVEPLLALHTTALPTATGIVADFTQSIWALRQSPLIELTSDGGDRFNKHQIGVKVTWRGDFALLDPEAFCSLTSIST